MANVAAELIPLSERKCRICSDIRRQEIEESLMVPGSSMRSVSRRYGLNLSNLQNHRPHMGAALDAARALKEIEGLSELYKRQRLRSAALWEMALKAGEKGQYQAAAMLAKAAREHEEMLSKFGEQPGYRPTEPQRTNINMPEARILIAPRNSAPVLPPAHAPTDHKAIQPSHTSEEVLEAEVVVVAS